MEPGRGIPLSTQCVFPLAERTQNTRQTHAHTQNESRESTVGIQEKINRFPHTHYNGPSLKGARMGPVQILSDREGGGGGGGGGRGAGGAGVEQD